MKIQFHGLYLTLTAVSVKMYFELQKIIKFNVTKQLILTVYLVFDISNKLHHLGKIRWSTF